MCGYLGILSTNDIDKRKTQIANNALICRGPDSRKDIFSTTNKYNNYKKNYNFNLIFNRLSILELSELGNQPMISQKYKTMMMTGTNMDTKIENEASEEKINSFLMKEMECCP